MFGLMCLCVGRWKLAGADRWGNWQSLTGWGQMFGFWLWFSMDYAGNVGYFWGYPRKVVWQRAFLGDLRACCLLCGGEVGRKEKRGLLGLGINYRGDWG